RDLHAALLVGIVALMPRHHLAVILADHTAGDVRDVAHFLFGHHIAAPAVDHPRVMFRHHVAGGVRDLLHFLFVLIVAAPARHHLAVLFRDHSARRIGD